ncbi:MAG: hypothetical protein ABIR33_10565 [Pyrinomonadaceae bacterium]
MSKVDSHAYAQSLFGFDAESDVVVVAGVEEVSLLELSLPELSLLELSPPPEEAAAGGAPLFFA